MYSLPQEIEVWYVIPAIRRELSKVLYYKYKIKQKEIAEILGISEAAVSQYLSKKRAKEIKFINKMNQEFDSSAYKISKNKKIVLTEIIRLVNLAKKYGIACEMCKKYNKGILTLCSCKPNKEIAK